MKGYAVRVDMEREKYEQLSSLVKVLGRTYGNRGLIPSSEVDSLFEIVLDYTYALDTLDRYDYHSLAVEETNDEPVFHATYENAREVIDRLKDKFGGSRLFLPSLNIRT